MITLKSIKYLAGMSQETHCYSATVYLHGVKVGTTGNAGHGGGNDTHYVSKLREQQVDEFIAALPEVESQFGGTLKKDLDWICADLVNDYLTRKDLKRLLSKRVLFMKKGEEGVYQTKSVDYARIRDEWAQQIDEKEDTDKVLNIMPFDEALEIYKAGW